MSSAIDKYFEHGRLFLFANPSQKNHQIKEMLDKVKIDPLPLIEEPVSDPMAEPMSHPSNMVHELSLEEQHIDRQKVRVRHEETREQFVREQASQLPRITPESVIAADDAGPATEIAQTKNELDPKIPLGLEPTKG